jgi:hypothetical protein
MTSTKLYEVRIDFGHSLVFLKGSKPHQSFYSNLTKASAALVAALSVNGWGMSGINYTAIYRSVKKKGSFVKYVRKNEVPFFRIEIIERVMNPGLNTFDIEPAPD